MGDFLHYFKQKQPKNIYFKPDLNAYNSIVIQDKTNNNAIIAPSTATDAYPFKTVYKKVKISDKTIAATSDNEYLIAIKIDSANAVTPNTSKFEFVPVADNN